jgi:hypothetical protein
MLDTFLAGVVNANVVNYKAEGDVRSIVLSETGGEGYMMVSKGGKGCNQLIVGQLACFRKAIHAFPDLQIYTVAVDECIWTVLLHSDKR